ncbi:DUF1254 domain-containing protein [bacterium]|nr:DUF1254 domain-containing protein [bacterium]
MVRQGLQMVQDGAEAYIFGYPLVLMETSRQVMTRSPGENAPLNHFRHVQYFPDHQFRKVVRPNNDTLYSTAWIDLDREPMVLSVPDSGGRYYVMPFMDAWTNVFAMVGKRTTGTGPGHFLIAGPDWQGEVPSGTRLIRSPTRMTWLIGRIQTNGQGDFENVFRLQAQFLLTPLSRWPGGPANEAYTFRKDIPGGLSDNPSATVAGMSAATFYGTLCRLMADQPPAAEDAPMLERLAPFGIVPGASFELNRLGFIRRLVLEKSLVIARQKIAEVAESDRSSENGWAVIRQDIGNYGTNYKVRALVALLGLGALPPEEAAYPNSEKDHTGRALAGSNRYRIHFEAGKTPPVNAFWSLTLYDQQGFLIDNPIRRYAIGDRDPLAFNPDGSLDILIQQAQPAETMTNWLPAPARNFAVTLRLYMPKPEFLEGRWKLPLIERLSE